MGNNNEQPKMSTGERAALLSLHELTRETLLYSLKKTDEAIEYQAKAKLELWKMIAENDEQIKKLKGN